jgi:hypothetical protein
MEYIASSNLPPTKCTTNKFSLLQDNIAGFRIKKYQYFPCKINMFRKRINNVVTSKGIQVGIECKYVK